MKIVRLEASNVKRLSAVDIRPDGSIVVIGGRNAQGKTSVLDAIAMAIGGRKLCPEEPLRRGAKEGHATVELDGGIVVTRTFTKKGGGGITVTQTVDGKKTNPTSPQGLLDKLVGALSFDPLQFTRMKPADQLSTLRDLVGADTSAIDGAEAAARTARTAIGRDQARLRGELEGLPPHHPEAPDEETSVTDVVAELTEAQERLDQVDRLDDANLQAAQDLDDAKARLEEKGTEITRMKAALEVLEVEKQDLKRSIAEGESALEEKKQHAAGAREMLVDPEPLREKLKNAEATNAQVRENARRAEVREKLDASDALWADLTTEIESHMEARQEMIRAAEFPVEGLAFGDDGVVFNELPFDQASGAEQLQVSVAMGLAMNPELKVLLVRDGSLLDEDHLALVAKMAEEADAQVWIERVGDGDEVQVLIEDGHVAGQEEASDGEA